MVVTGTLSDCTQTHHLMMVPSDRKEKLQQKNPIKTSKQKPTKHNPIDKIKQKKTGLPNGQTN